MMGVVERPLDRRCAAAVLLLAACHGGPQPPDPSGSEGGTVCVPLEPEDDLPLEDVVVPFVGSPDAFALPQTFFATSGHGGYSCDPGVPVGERRCALDIHAMRWEPSTGTYTRSLTRSDDPRPVPFSDDVMWGVELRSPVDGEVIACWRRMPDDDDDFDDVSCPGGERECIAGGNHVQILSDDGELWFLGHLQQDSIPPELCPIDEVYLYEDDGKACDLPAPWEGLRNGSRLDRRGLEPIRVSQGDLVGRAGTSGNGQGVHVHVHRKPFELDDAGNPCEAPSLPLAFESMWVHERESGRAPSQWAPREGQRLPIDGSSMLLWPAVDPPAECH